jgi:hypothetical protein
MIEPLDQEEQDEIIHSARKEQYNSIEDEI